MNISQADSVCESLLDALNNLKEGFYLSDETENEIVGFNPIGSWMVEVIYDNEESSLVHCTNILVHSKHY
ncbi:hypothetical protein [Enterococcus thailandicus]|uniref:hypothetical protein n=1 Tax=Enterococcus thailandicus TaxID=417368 RepID=UPI000A9723CE|nr:hypothetical protein [Enterococcus thailandicus]MDT2794294.1 hypothetical protein [Enterococcus thailandicus]